MLLDVEVLDVDNVVVLEPGVEVLVVEVATVLVLVDVAVNAVVLVVLPVGWARISTQWYRSLRELY